METESSHVSDLEPSSSPDLPPFSHAEPLDNLLREGRREREGLPATYRMRADPHYVDQLLDAPRDVPVIRLIRTRQIEAADLAPADGSPAFARSIAEHGILQPLLVRPSGARYQLIAGRKRLGAALMAGLTEVPCMVHDVDAASAALLSAADNLRANPDVVAIGARERDSLNDGLAILSDDVGDMIPLIDLLKRGNAPQHGTFADVLLVQAWRAAWLVNAVALATQPYRPTERRLLGAIVERLQRAFEQETRLNRGQVSFSVAADAASRAVDNHFGTALAALAFVALSWQKRNDPPTVEARVDAVDASTIKIQVVHRTATADPAALHLIEGASGTPAGDPRIAIAIEAARSYVHHYGGRFDVTPIGNRGSVIQASVTTPLTD
jgi:hypothetical protein